MSEARDLRRELDAANDRNLLLQREVDRLRSLASEVRADHHAQLELSSRRVADAESRASRADSAKAAAEEALDRAQRETRDAQSRQERHANAVQEVRDQVRNRMDRLVEALAEKEEENHTLHFQVRERARDKDRIVQLEKMLSARDAAMNELTSNYSRLRSEHDSIILQLSALQSQAAMREASATRASHRSRSAARDDSAPPPPPAPANDPHVMETAAIVTSCRDWCQETDRAVTGLEDIVEAQFDTLQDLRLVLERGVSNVGAEALGSAALNLDRQRLAQLRRTEQRRLEQQMAAVSDTASSAALVRSLMSNARFNFGKLKNTMDQVSEYIGQLRKLVDRHCGQTGLPAMSSRWEQWAKMRPEPLPMPNRGGDGTPTSPADPTSHLSSPAAVAASAKAEVDDLRSRMKTSQEEADELREKLREALRRSDELVAEAHTRAREDADSDRKRHDEERSELLRRISGLNDELHAARNEAQEASADARRRHADELHEVENERQRVATDLEARLAVASRELEEAHAAKLRDASQLDEIKTKRKAMKMELLELRETNGHLSGQVAELTRDVEDAHRHIDQLETELDSAKAALDFEVQQQEQAVVEAASFHQWKQAASHAASHSAAASAPMAAGFVAGGAPGPATAVAGSWKGPGAGFVQRSVSRRAASQQRPPPFR